MKFMLVTLLMLCATVSARADVGIIKFDQGTQEMRSGDRFRISVSAEKERFRTVTVFIKKREGERPVRADLSVGNQIKPDARIPVKLAPAKMGAGFYIALEMTNEFAKRCDLAILVDFTHEDGIQSGTSFQIDLGSYFDGP